jgi:hypothetical protein
MRGAYFDPNTNIRYDTNNADFEGERACPHGISPLDRVFKREGDVCTIMEL